MFVFRGWRHNPVLPRSRGCRDDLYGDALLG